MKLQWKIIQLVLLTIFIFCGCSSRHSHLDSMVKNLTVPEKTLLAITNGESLVTITGNLGIAARHVFTAAETNGNYTLISCYFSGGDNFLWFLFHDKTLIKVIAPFSFPKLVETYPYEGTTASRIKSWDIDDPGIAGRITKLIDAPALTRDQIIDYLRPDTNTTSRSWNVFPAFILSGFLWKAASQIEKDYETNESLLEHYDGCQANLGMSADDVEKLYGKPLRVFVTKNGETARIYGYGETRELQVNPQLVFAGMAIVCNTNGHVTAIYSGYPFFNDGWKK
jgi:hypothetical protein